MHTRPFLGVALVCLVLGVAGCSDDETTRSAPDDRLTKLDSPGAGWTGSSGRRMATYSIAVTAKNADTACSQAGRWLADAVEAGPGERVFGDPLMSTDEFADHCRDAIDRAAPDLSATSDINLGGDVVDDGIQYGTYATVETEGRDVTLVVNGVARRT